jgi:response regulator RpfG family c-di-GMP phosphodiesterase
MEAARAEGLNTLPTAVQLFMRQLVELQLLTSQQAAQFMRQAQQPTNTLLTPEKLGEALVATDLLSNYQLRRVLGGHSWGLVLGQYKILDKLGGGSVGMVYLGEHRLLKRRVAIKVLPVDEHFPPAVLERFHSEMRVLANLHHPNIVMAYDAGTAHSPEIGLPTLHYLVMELVSGGDLEQYVYDHNILPIAQGCEFIRQAAAGLQEAHDHHLIHRDLKPSNLLLTKDKRVKLVDFGLARQFSSNLTERSSLLGSVEFMAPEQSLDPTGVSAAADIYGLGATLFWLVSGQTPFPQSQNLVEVLKMLQTERPRRLREVLPNCPPELDEFVDKLLARDPADRPPLPLMVMKGLARFANPASSPWDVDIWNEAIQKGEALPQATAEAHSADAPAVNAHITELTDTNRVLVVEDEDNLRQLAVLKLRSIGCTVLEAADGAAAAKVLETERIDLILLDQRLPDYDGAELCRLFREQLESPHTKIILWSGYAGPNGLANALEIGANDFFPKPTEMDDLAAKVKYLLRQKAGQDRADRLTRHLLNANQQLESSLSARGHDVHQAHDALLFAMAKMAESRDGETSSHLRRMSKYTTILAEKLAAECAFNGAIDQAFISLLDRCVPLHDIGKIGLPDSVLLKPGPLDEDERHLMETHPLMGAEILDAIAAHFGEGLAFMSMARAVVRNHHERYDGFGYPDRLAGEAIPLAARLVALADVYDALRRVRAYKPALTHAQAVRTIVNDSKGQFDPVVLRAFVATEGQFATIFQVTVD